MKHTRTLGLLLLLAVAAAFAVGCAAQQEQTPPPPPPQEEPVVQQPEQARVDSLEQARQDSIAQAAEMERQRIEAERREMMRKQEEERQAKNSLQTVYFDFDKSELKPEARDRLQQNAEVIMEYDQWQILVEGHTDERGSTEYNLALGERRANAVKEYYVNYGVDASRIEIISYGEERPAVEGTGEAVWSQNRRAVTKVKE